VAARALAHDLASSQRLAHVVGTNGFSSALLRSARTRPGCALTERWSERHCAREWRGRPPRRLRRVGRAGQVAAVPVRARQRHERPDRLAGKLDGYARLAAEAGHPNWALVRVPGAARPTPGASWPTRPRPSAPPPGARAFVPDGAVWLPVASTGPRLRVAQLAALPLGGP
jgi:hypothetical protein